MKRAIITLISLFFIVGCNNTSKEMNYLEYADEDTEIIDVMLSFIESGNYMFSTLKSDLPTFVMDTLQNRKVAIGDSTELDRITLSDLWELPRHIYGGLLFFSLINQDEVLLCSKYGGLGSHYVIEYFDSSRKIHIYYGTFEYIRSVEATIETLKRAKKEDLLWEKSGKL